MATTPLMQLLQGYLKVTSDRQQIVASNIANVDTPGYHVKDINFQSAMQQVMLKGDDAQLGPATNDVEGLPERPDVRVPGVHAVHVHDARRRERGRAW